MNNDQTPTREAAVNTFLDLDLNFQLGALTDRCISLEKTLIEERNTIAKL